MGENKDFTLITNHGRDVEVVDTLLALILKRFNIDKVLKMIWDMVKFLQDVVSSYQFSIVLNALLTKWREWVAKLIFLFKGKISLS